MTRTASPSRKRPYLILTATGSTNLGERMDDVESEDTSRSINLYITKKQATELAEMPLQEELEGLLEEGVSVTTRKTPMSMGDGGAC